MVPHYLYAVKIPIPQIWYLNLLQCHLWIPTPLQPPASHIPSQPENTVTFWFDLITMNRCRSIWTGVNNTDFKGWPGCSQKNCTQGESLLGLGSQQNDTSSCWGSKPTWAIRLLCHWIPDPPQSLLSRKCCHLLTLLVLNYGSGFFTFCRGILSFAKRVSSLVLCLVSWVGQKPTSEVHPWGMKAESSITLLQRIILSRLSQEKLWKHSHTGRRKHTFKISREKGNYYHPSE